MTYREVALRGRGVSAGDAVVSMVIEAPPAEVARVCCDFASIHEWHPAFAQCTVEGTGIGAVRTLDMGGSLVRERLEHIQEDGFGYFYAVLSHPMPLANGLGFICVFAGEREGTSVVEWTVAFDPAVAAIPKATIAPSLVHMCRLGLTNLATHFRPARPRPPAQWGADEGTTEERTGQPFIQAQAPSRPRPAADWSDEEATFEERVEPPKIDPPRRKS